MPQLLRRISIWGLGGLLSLSLLGCGASLNEHMFRSTPESPKSIRVYEPMTGLQWFQYDIPVYTRMKLKFYGKGQQDFIKVDPEIPPTRMKWEVYESLNTPKVARKGFIDLPGRPVQIEMVLRKGPEWPSNLTPPNPDQLTNKPATIPPEPAKKPWTYTWKKYGKAAGDQGVKEEATPMMEDTQPATPDGEPSTTPMNESETAAPAEPVADTATEPVAAPTEPAASTDELLPVPPAQPAPPAEPAPAKPDIPPFPEDKALDVDMAPSK